MICKCKAVRPQHRGGRQNHTIIRITKMNDRIQNVSGRLLVEQAAGVLGFKRHDIPILVKASLLQPLGNPARHSVKYFAAAELVTLAGDTEWLGRATKAVYTYWRKQNKKRRPKAGTA